MIKLYGSSTLHGVDLPSLLLDISSTKDGWWVRNKGRRDLFVVERKIACYFHNELRTHTDSFNSIMY